VGVSEGTSYTGQGSIIDELAVLDMTKARAKTHESAPASRVLDRQAVDVVSKHNQDLAKPFWLRVSMHTSELV